MMIHCLILDDNPLAIDILADHVRKIPFLELAATATNPITALQMVRQQQIDLIFADIQMPELNGLQFIKLVNKQCKIVLTTAYSEYALEGFEHDVIDYLLKPISFERFYRAVEKALQVIEHPGKIIIAQKSPLTVTNPHTGYLFIKTEHRIQRVNINDILYIESLQNYVRLHTRTEQVLSLQSLKKIEEQLPQKEFVRVHKSFIVSLQHITYVERSRIFINDISIPVGDNYRAAFYNSIDKTP